jgi:hypothetical protein
VTPEQKIGLEVAPMARLTVIALALLLAAGAAAQTIDATVVEVLEPAREAAAV